MSSSDWEDIPSNTQESADSPTTSSRRKRSNKHNDTNPSSTNNDSRRSNVGGDSRGESPIQPVVSVSNPITIPTLNVATNDGTSQPPPPRNESFTMIDTPRGPKDRNLQEHSVSVVAGGGDDGEKVTAVGASSSRPPLHPPSPMVKKSRPPAMMDASGSSQQTTPLSLDPTSHQESTAAAFPRIPPPRSHSQASSSAPQQQQQQQRPSQYQQSCSGGTTPATHDPHFAQFPSATSMDSLMGGGPQSLHFSPNTPMQQGSWKDVTGQQNTPGSSMTTDMFSNLPTSSNTPLRGNQLQQQWVSPDQMFGTGPGRGDESQKSAFSPDASLEEEEEVNNSAVGNSAVCNHQATLFSSVLAGFDDGSKERRQQQEKPKKQPSSKNEKPGGPALLSGRGGGGAAPRALNHNNASSSPQSPSLNENTHRQPTAVFSSEDEQQQQPHSSLNVKNSASEVRSQAAAASRASTIKSLSLPPPHTTTSPSSLPLLTPRTGRGAPQPPRALISHQWRPYLLSVYRWQRPRHSIVATTLVVSGTTILLPLVFVGIGPVRFVLFSFAVLQALCGLIILAVGVPILRPLFVRSGILDAELSSSSPRKQVRKYITNTIRSKISAVYKESHASEAIPQLGEYLWDKLLELADPTEAVQGEHEAAIKVIQSNQKRRKSLEQPLTSKHLDPFSGVKEDVVVVGKDEEAAIEVLLQQSAYYESGASAAAAMMSSSSTSSSLEEQEKQKKATTIDVVVQEALRMERHALAKKLFLMFAAAVVIIEPILDWAVNDMSSPTSMFLFLFGVFICGRYPTRRILRREYIRRYGLTAGPFISPRLTSSAASSPRPVKVQQQHPQPVAASSSSSPEPRSRINDDAKEEEEDCLQHTFMDTVTASVRSFVIGPLEDEVENSEVFSGRPSEEFHRSPSPLPNGRSGGGDDATSTVVAPDALLKQTMRDINRRRAMSTMENNNDETFCRDNRVSVAPATVAPPSVPVTIKWVVADTFLLTLMAIMWALWKFIFRVAF